MKNSEALLQILRDSKDDSERREALTSLNKDHGFSLRAIARSLGTYVNKVMRECQKLGVVFLNKSEIQTKMLGLGITTHPTAGKEFTEEHKERLGQAQAKTWDDDRKKMMSDVKKEQWNDMEDYEKKQLLKSAGEGIRKASKEGSKLEKYIREYLLNVGFNTEAHKTGVLPNQDLEFDLYVPKLRTIIEIDGPSHFKPIWGHDQLQKSKVRDSQKSGLALNYGFCFIRIKQIKKHLSKVYMKELADKLSLVLDQIKTEFPKSSQDRYFEIQ